MPLDVSQLQKVKRRGDKITAQCPACAEAGADKRGDHLAVFADGRFACIAFQGDHEHRRRIFELVGMLDDAPPFASAPTPAPAKAKPAEPIDWQADGARLKRDASALERLARWRGWSVEFATALVQAGVIGMHEGRIDFRVVDDRGVVIGRHVFQWPEVIGGPKAWYAPGKNWPLLIGAETLAGVMEVHIVESQWDALAMLHAKGWTGGPLKAPFVATRGTSINPALRELLQGVPAVTLWMQRDAPKAEGQAPPSEAWLQRVLDLLPDSVTTVRRVDTPEGAKDWNDVLRERGASATVEAIKTAVRAAVSLPCQNLRNLRIEGQGSDCADNADFVTGSDASGEGAPCEAVSVCDDECEDQARQEEPFPLDALPDMMRAMATEGARVSLAPVTLTACCALGAVSASIGGGLEVASGGERRTRGNLFLLPVAASGTGKGRAHEVIMKPFTSAETTALFEWRERVRPRALAEMAAAEERIKRLKATLGKSGAGDAVIDQLADAERELEATKLRTVEPTWATADVTGPALQRLLADSPSETLASLSPEAREVVDVLAGKFSDGKGDESIYLSAYSGETYKAHRKSSLPVILARPCLTVLWMIQPDKLREMLGNVSLVDSGLMPRFLVCDTKAEPMKEPEHWPVMDAAVNAKWCSVIKELARTFRDRGKEPQTIATSAEVQAIFRDYFNGVVDQRRTGGELADVASFAARWSENAWRVAVVLHAAEHGVGAPYSPMTKETAANAIRIVQWFARQQLRVLAAGRHERRASRLESLKAALMSYPDRRATLRDLERRNGIAKEEVTMLARNFPSMLALETIKREGPGRRSETVRLIGK